MASAVKGASVVIIGGGVVGASVAYHLAAAGVADVIVLDRGAEPGAGSSGRATGGFRAQFSTAMNVRLSLLARERLRRFEEETGVDPGFEPVGYLWLARDEAALAALAAARAVQHAEGLTEARAVTPEEIAALNPAVRLDGIVGGAFCPTDGTVRPLDLLHGYRAAATKLGARFRYGQEVTGLVRGGDGRITSILAGRQRYAAERVVNAAGPWAAAVARWAGVTLPVAPLKRQIAVTRPFEGLPPTMPMTIFLEDGFHLRVRDGRVLLLWPTDPDGASPFDTTVDPGWVSAVFAKARERIPVLGGARVDEALCAAGLYEMSPDRHAILGVAPGCPNLYLANGSSGHGVMHAPALGLLLAEILKDGRASTLDVTPLRPTRFDEGAAFPPSELL
ncbi:MAG: NAD(P)/FAD-dependent oxidoreductase [Hyphomicrobiales bacterium]